MPFLCNAEVAAAVSAEMRSNGDEIGSFMVQRFANEVFDAMGDEDDEDAFNRALNRLASPDSGSELEAKLIKSMELVWGHLRPKPAQVKKKPRRAAAAAASAQKPAERRTRYVEPPAEEEPKRYFYWADPDR